MLTLNSRPIAPAFTSHGFSLMELAVVLMIVGTLMSGILVAVSQSTENSRRSSAMAQLRQIEEALYGFAQVHHYLPCPATNASNGRAAPDDGSACTSADGFIPAATLNLAGPTDDNRLLLDPWQNPVRYSVAGNFDFNQPANLASVFNTASFNAGMLRICNTATCNAGEVIADSVPAVVYSMGSNWAGIATASAEEQANGNGGPDFVSTTYSEENFDDLLVWLSPYTLFNRLVSTGSFPP